MTSRQQIGNLINSIIDLIPKNEIGSPKLDKQRLQLAMQLKDWEEKLDIYLEGDEFITPKNNTQIAIGNGNNQNIY